MNPEQGVSKLHDSINMRLASCGRPNPYMRETNMG